MNRRFSVTAIIAVFGMVTFFIEGCATNRVDLVDKGVVSVETVPGKRIDILWIDVYRQGGDSIIYGALQQRGQRMCP